MVLIKSPKECKERTKISWGISLGATLLLGICIVLSSRSNSSIRVTSSDVSPPDMTPIKRDQQRYLRKHEIDGQFQCQGWHTTRGFAPFSLFRFLRYLQHVLLRQPGLGCDDDIPGDESGYCAIVDTKTGAVLRDRYTQDYDRVTFRREMMQEPFIRCRLVADFLNMKTTLKAVGWEPKNEPSTTIHQGQEFATTPHQRGIIMKVDRNSLPGVYANLQLLRRDHKCKLPVELWMNGGEDSLSDSIFDQPILKLILEDPLIKMKFHWDWKYQGAGNLIYGAIHSNFDEVLLLDNGSFPLKDPSFLFEDPQYKETGALFWKSLWSHTGTGKKAKKRKSILTAIAGQGGQRTSAPNLETGQMVINRRKRSKELQLLLFMIGRFPDALVKFRLPHGIGDFIPIVWEMTGTKLSLVEHVPELIGVPRSIGASYEAAEFLTPLNYISQKATSHYRLCGLSSLYLDPQGHPLFVDRPNAPLSNRLETLEYKVWLDYKVWDRAVTILANQPNAQFEQLKFVLDYDDFTAEQQQDRLLSDDLFYKDDDLFPQSGGGSDEATTTTTEGRPSAMICSFPKLEAQESFQERPLRGTEIARLEDIIVRYAREAYGITEKQETS